MLRTCCAKLNISYVSERRHTVALIKTVHKFQNFFPFTAKLFRIKKALSATSTEKNSWLLKDAQHATQIFHKYSITNLLYTH